MFLQNMIIEILNSDWNISHGMLLEQKLSDLHLNLKNSSPLKCEKLKEFVVRL